MAGKKPVPLVGLMAFFGILLGIGAYGWRAAHAQERSRSEWIPVEARIRSATMEIDEDHHEYHTITYIPRLVYDYQVEGRSLTGSRIYLVRYPGLQDREAAEVFLSRYPVGGAVTAYVDPTDPREATLLFDASSTPYLLCLISATFAALFVLGVLVHLHWLPRVAGLLGLIGGWYALLAWVIAHWWRNCDPVGAAWVAVWGIFIVYAALGLIPSLMLIGTLIQRGKPSFSRPSSLR